MGKRLVGCLFFVLFPILAYTQAVPPAANKIAYLSVGGFYTVAQMDYGQYHSMGWGGYSDLNYRVWKDLGVGLEGEAHIIDFRLRSGTSFQNYLGGVRVAYEMPYFRRHFEPYAKVLGGGTRFHYPPFITNKVYDYSTWSVGGGVDVKISNRWYWRAADFEDLHLWNYPPYALTPWTLSSGISFRVF